MVSFINHADGGNASNHEPDFEPEPVPVPEPAMSELSISIKKRVRSKKLFLLELI
jgi:hypothetical protein